MTSLQVAGYVLRLRYQGLEEEQQRRLSRLAAGILPVSIVNSLVGSAQTLDKAGGFTLYSAHDNTIMAMLAHLGDWTILPCLSIDASTGFKNFPVPRFAAHLIFELHEIGGEHFVKFMYNNGTKSDPVAVAHSCTT